MMHNHQQLGAAMFATAAAAVVGILAYRRFKESTRSKSLLEQIGGEAAVDAAVNLFYKKMLADERVRVFFAYTNMAHQVQRQKNFLLYVLDAGNRHKYHGLSMDKAHARLISEGIKDPQTGKVHKMDDSHFNATAENLQKTFEELNVPKHLIDTIMGAVESLREQVMCRGKYAAALKPAAPSLLDQIGGEAAVDAAVSLFYKKMLADERVRVFFTYTNMAHQSQRQKNFLLYVLDAGNRHKYHGLSMDKAHARLITEGIKDPETGKVYKMDDSHFNATAENLQKTFEELGVPKHLIDTIMGAVESLREQVMCRGQYAAALQSVKPAAPSLLEQVGGEAAVDAAVSLFYKKMLADERVRVFFAYTNMAHQAQRQKNFLLYVLDAGNRHKYHGLSMDKAHARLITQGIKDPETGKVYKMDDSHFNATAENLRKTFEELNVPKALIDTIMGAVEGLREQVMCRGKYAAALENSKKA